MRGLRLWGVLSGEVSCPPRPVAPTVPVAPPPVALAPDATQADKDAAKSADDTALADYDRKVQDHSTAVATYRLDLTEYTQWIDEDARAAAVLTSSVLPQYAAEFMGLPTAAAQWAFLRQRYQPSGDALYLSVVRQEHALQQGDSTIDEFYTQSAAIWRQLDSLRTAVCATCPCCLTVRADLEFQRVFEFLSRLRKEFEPRRAQLLARGRVPLSEVLAELRAEETRLRGAGLLEVPSVLAARGPPVPSARGPPMPPTSLRPPAQPILPTPPFQGHYPWSSWSARWYRLFLDGYCWFCAWLFWHRATTFFHTVSRGTLSTTSFSDRRTQALVGAGPRSLESPGLWELDWLRVPSAATSSASSPAVAASVTGSFQQWHHRLGHLCGSRLSSLVRRGLLGEESISPSTCVVFLLSRAPLPSSRVPVPMLKMVSPSRRAPARYSPSQYGLSVVSEPTSYRDAERHPEWQLAMAEEIAALERTGTWDLVSPPSGVRPITCKWVYKIKTRSDGSLERYKARLVARGFQQEHGRDYDETFAPVAHMTTVRTLLAVASVRRWSVSQLDVQNAFLNGELSEEVYMQPPPGYSVPDGMVCRLRRSLYGLKQAPRAWFERFASVVTAAGFSPSLHDPALFVHTSPRGRTLLLLYVDDMIITGDDPEYIAFVKIVEVFMDDFSVYGNSFDNCLRNLDKVLQRCEETNLVLNWEKCHFMVNEGIVLGHKISERGIEVDRAKVEAIEKMPYPRDVKGIRSILGHAGFYRRFIKDFSKISKPLTNLLQKYRSSLEFLFGKSTTTATVVDEAPGEEVIPYKIPMKIIERVVDNRYEGDGTVHPGDHLLFLHELCGLFKCAGISMDEVRKKLFVMSLSDKTLLDTSCSGSFTRNKEEFKWDLLDRIQENTEGWENDKGRVSAYIEKTPFPAKMKEYSVITSVVNKSAKKPIEPEEQIKVEPAVAIVKDLVTENVEDGHIIFCEDASNIVSHPNKSMKASVPVLSVRIGDHCYYGLCDIGASISAIPYELYTEIMHEIGSCELEDIDVVIRLANRETISPIGIVRDVEVLCGKIKYPADFLVLGSAASKFCPIIFGRPFLNTCGAIIDCKKEKIVTKFAGESYEFNFSKFAKTPYKADFPNDDFRVEQCASIALAPSNPLQQHLENSESEVFREERDELDEIFLRQPILKHDLPVEDLGVTPPPKEDPVFDLKPLPDNLKYAYIDDKKTYPVIISAKLSDIEEERLLEILKKHRGAIGYTLDDLKGISPAICQHAINIEDGAKPVVEHQRRLIPKMKDVVRNEVLKLLEADIVFRSRATMSSSESPKDNFFENVVNPYISELKMHPKELLLVDGELQIEDVRGPKGEGSLEDRMEKLEQEVFTYKKMVEREVDIFHRIVSELIGEHEKETAKLWSDILSLHNTTNQLQAQLYDAWNQNCEYENRFKRISDAASFRIPETKTSFVDGEPLPWKSDDEKNPPPSPSKE
ncbi:hypothetical protein QYE76_052552 [Lolium multiflorum]|uniref:Uncharacterized protein n=1 Tax=Lolium multiflorum TaxID=4521 RepID=A0AAD8STY2_LOLMU|nr:hypothetical protein QYE76_052552 [Lolium multiflorum]